MTYEHLSFRVAHDFCTRLDEEKKMKNRNQRKMLKSHTVCVACRFHFFLSFQRCCCCSYYSSRIIYFRTFGCFTSEKTKVFACMFWLVGWVAGCGIYRFCWTQISAFRLIFNVPIYIDACMYVMCCFLNTNIENKLLSHTLKLPSISTEYNIEPRRFIAAIKSKVFCVEIYSWNAKLYFNNRQFSVHFNSAIR